MLNYQRVNRIKKSKFTPPKSERTEHRRIVAVGAFDTSCDPIPFEKVHWGMKKMGYQYLWPQHSRKPCTYLYVSLKPPPDGVLAVKF